MFWSLSPSVIRAGCCCVCVWGGCTFGQCVKRASIRHGLVMRCQLTFLCSLQRPRRKRANLSIVISPSSSFIPPSMVKRRKVIPARSYFTPSICLLLLPSLPSLLHHLTPPFLYMSPSLHLSFCLSQSLALSLPSACLSLSLSLSQPPPPTILFHLLSYAAKSSISVCKW